MAKDNGQQQVRTLRESLGFSPNSPIGNADILLMLDHINTSLASQTRATRETNRWLKTIAEQLANQE